MHKGGETAERLTDIHNYLQLFKASGFSSLRYTDEDGVVFLVDLHVAAMFFYNTIDKSQKQEMGTAFFLWFACATVARLVHNGPPFCLVKSINLKIGTHRRILKALNAEKKVGAGFIPARQFAELA